MWSSTRFMRLKQGGEKTLYLRPQTLVLGVGCKKGMEPERMMEAFRKFTETYVPDIRCIRAVATVDKKSGEAAILHLAERLDVPLMIISRKMIGNLDFQTVPGGPLGVFRFCGENSWRGLCGRGQCLSGQQIYGGGAYETGRCVAEKEAARLKIRKQKYEGITFAVAEMKQTIAI